MRHTDNGSLRSVGHQAPLLSPATKRRFKIDGWLALQRLGHRWGGSARLTGDTVQPAAIACVSLPRSGTNYLCDLLNCHPQINSHYEIFHRDATYLRSPDHVLPALNYALKASFESPTDRELIAFAHRRPGAFLRALASENPGSYLSFKIFRGHLDRRRLFHHILADSDILKVIYRRNPLDSYISFQKAKASTHWDGHDTTNVRIRVDAQEFAAYLARVNNWYDFVQRCLVSIKQPFVVLNYEDVVQKGTELERLSLVVSRLRAANLKVLMPGECRLTNVTVARKKQDASKRAADKVENYARFASDLRRLGLARFVDAEPIRREPTYGLARVAR